MCLKARSWCVFLVCVSICNVHLLYANLRRGPEGGCSTVVQRCTLQGWGWGLRSGEEKKRKIKSCHIFTRSICGKTRQLARRRRRRRRSMRRQRRLRCRRFFHPPLLSASPQIVKFLGNVLQLRLDGCQAFNLLLLHIYNERTARRLLRCKKQKKKQKTNKSPNARQLWDSLDAICLKALLFGGGEVADKDKLTT